jgi:DNA polymerase-3 subunit epsilon
MRICVWDTETTGFPVREWALEQQPYIVQFAAIIWEIDENQNYKETERYDILIKPRISIPFGASQVHGIYDRDVENAPYIEQQLDVILKVLNSADIVAWHNISYDEEVLSYELARSGRTGEYTPTKSLCTMKSSTDYCKLQWRWFSYKPPKLAELHRFLFDEWFEWAHNAMVDVEATMRSFIELVKRWVIPLETTNVMRLF